MWHKTEPSSPPPPPVAHHNHSLGSSASIEIWQQTEPSEVGILRHFNIRDLIQPCSNIHIKITADFVRFNFWSYKTFNNGLSPDKGNHQPRGRDHLSNTANTLSPLHSIAKCLRLTISRYLTLFIVFNIKILNLHKFYTPGTFFSFAYDGGIYFHIVRKQHTFNIKTTFGMHFMAIYGRT